MNKVEYIEALENLLATRLTDDIKYISSRFRVKIKEVYSSRFTVYGLEGRS